MNIQYIKLGLLATLFVGGTALFTSCADDLDVGTQFDKEMYNGVYENNAYLRDGKSNKVSNIVELYGETYQTSVKLGLSKAPVTETSARVKIDAAYLAAYNKVHGTEFELYPENLISFANEGKLVVNAAAKSAEVNMAIQAGEALQEDKTYGLVWEDKPEDVEERLRDELPILTEVPERAIISEDKDAPNHFLIEGDNLEALATLAYTHEGKIDVIYICLLYTSPSPRD